MLLTGLKLFHYRMIMESVTLLEFFCKVFCATKQGKGDLKGAFRVFFNHIISVLCQKVQFPHFANIFASFCFKLMVF